MDRRRRLISRIAAIVSVFLTLSLVSVSGNTAEAKPSAAKKVSAAPDSPQPGQFYGVRGRAASAVDIAANGTATVKVAGVAGVPASGVASVALNVWAKGATAAGSLVVYPSGTTAPAAGALSYRGSDPYVHNLVTVGVGSDGQVKVTNKGGGTVRVYADLYGYTLSQPGATAGSVFVAMTPVELFYDVTVPANGDYVLKPLGKNGIPGSGVTHVAITLSYYPADSTANASGKLTVYPSGTAKPGESNLQYAGAGVSAKSHVIAQVGADGGIVINNAGPAVGIAVTANGYYRRPTAASIGAVLKPVQPTRIASNVSVNAGGTLNVKVLGKGGIPDSPAVWAVDIAVTVTSPGAEWGSAAAVNASYVVPNIGSTASTGSVFAKPDGAGNIKLWNGGVNVKMTVQIDAFGYFSGPVKPAAPTAVTGTPRHQAVLVSWQPPANDGGAAITRYTVTSSPAAGSAVTTSGTQATMTGLTNGTAYTFTVTAENLVGTGPPSAPSAPIKPAQGTAPSAPLKVATTPQHGSVGVSWQKPSNDGGAEITKYTVTASPGGETVTAWYGDTEARVTGLTNGQPYVFTVTATNVIGTGPASAPSATTAPEAARPPGTPLITELYPRDGAVRVSWSPPDPGPTGLTGYEVTASPGGQKVTAAADQTETIVPGLTNGTRYSFTVTAINGTGRTASRASGPIAPEPGVVPLMPAGLLTVPLNGRIDVQWVAPADGGSPITGYRVTAEPGGRTVDVPAGTTVAAITGLTNDTAYTIKVVAANQAGASEPAQQAGVTPRAARAPGAPPELEAAASATGTVALAWSPPVDTGTAPISGYTVTASPGGKTVTSTGGTATMTGLDPAVQYSFTIAATNAHGTGPPGPWTDPIAPKVTVVNPPVVLSDASVQALRKVSAGTLDFEQPPAQVTGLTAGAIIVVQPTAKAPNGLFRMVTAVARPSGLVRLSTRGAAMNEALEDGAFSINSALDTGDGGQLAAAMPGIRLRQPTIRGKTVRQGARAAAAAPPDGPVSIRNGTLVLEVAIGTDPRTDPQGRGGRIEATFTLKPTIRPRIWISGRKLYFDFYVSVALGADSRVRLGLGSDIDYSKRFVNIKFPTRTIWVYGVPVRFRPTFSLTFNAQAAVPGGVSAAVRWGREVGAHVWKDDNGVHFEKIDKSPYGAAGAISFSLSARAQLGLIADFALIFYEAGGPGFDVHPYVEWIADTAKNPWWEEWLGLRVDGFLRASDFLGGGEVRADRLIDQRWKTRDAGGPFSGIVITPVTTTVEPGKFVTFRVTFINMPAAPIQWEVIGGPGTIDGNGRYVSDRPGLAAITATSSGKRATATVLVQCPTGTSSTPSGWLTPPRDLRPSAGPESARVTWTPPSSQGDLPVQEYALITYPPSRTTYVTADQTTADLEGLTPAETYYIVAYAITDAAVSPASQPAGPVVPTE